MPQAYSLNLFQRGHDTNLIDNWSFETDIATGWTDANWETAEQSAAFAKIGTYSAHFDDATFDGDEYFRTDLITGIVAGREYEANEWVKKVTCTGTGYMSIWWYTAASAFISSSVAVFDAGAHAWKKYSVTGTAPATAAQAIVWAFSPTGVTVATAFDAYIDGVIFRETIPTGLAYTGDLTYHARAWKRKSRAVGGYWQGSFVLSSNTLSKAELDSVYNAALGTRLVETCYGMTSWEGMVWTMDYHQRGSTFRRTLDKSIFHNQVDVWYSGDDGDKEMVGTSTNTDSEDEYGLCTLIASIGGANAVAATAMRDSLLVANAWPRSREVGTLTIGEGDRPSEDYIAVTVAGYWHTLNWQYRSYSIDDTPNGIFTNLISTAEFVSEGRVETNADVVRLDAFPIPLQKGDAVARVINFGDSSGDVWQGGVYAGRLFNYEQAPTTWDHQYRDGRLLDKAGQDVPFPLVEPGFLLFNASAPTGGQPPGTSTEWDDPRIRYVEEVEFVAPGQIRLRFSAASAPLIIAERIRSGIL